MIARLPEPPYYAVIFASRRGAADPEGYGATADAMLALAAGQPGYLGVESVRDADGFGLTVSYWTDLEAMQHWKAVRAHQAAQRLGRERWYEDYVVRIARVERAYGFARGE
ncbi:MAG: antibiotic biosynthesis monooxygenase [Pelomonas sp.]|nr:antibiotic biosynthesis monooxygenase [Roseateles sp.]